MSEPDFRNPENSATGPERLSIVSGGQTGVDRAALDVAIFMDIPHGGWCPHGRIAEDGMIPAIYNLRETDSRNYAVRTEQNVIDSDGTLILFIDRMSGGTLLTSRFAEKHGRPAMRVGLSDSVSPGQVSEWLVDENVGVLNVAGPRESSHPGIGRIAEQFLVKVFQNVRSAVDSSVQ